jgi:hypothetical protein
LKVNMQPVDCIPAYVREAAHPVVPHVASPSLGPNTQVALYGLKPTVLRDTRAHEQEMMVSFLKLLTEGIAQHYRHHALVADKLLWLCVSGFELAKESQQASEPWGKALGIAGLAVGTAEVAVSLLNAPRLQETAAHLDFFLEQGGKALRGDLTLSYADLAKLQGDVSVVTQAKLQLMDILGSLNNQFSKEQLNGPVQNR